MKYKVKDADAEGHRLQKFGDNNLVEKLEHTVRVSSVLIGALGLSLIALAVYTTVLVLSDYNTPQPCLSEECVGTASRILQSMNIDVDPCKDFYEFACGGWIKRNPVPEWTSVWHQLTKLREQLANDMRELLEENNNDGLPESVLKAKALYRTCMKDDKLEEDGTKPIQKILIELGLPAHPPVQASENFTWEETAGRGRRMLGLNVLLSVQVAQDVRNITRNLLMIDQISPGFNEHYFMDPTRYAQQLDMYHKFVKDMISEADPQTDAQVFADDIMEFSSRLAKVMGTMEERRSQNHLTVEMSVSQLIEGVNNPPVQWKEHDWDRYLKEVFSNRNVTLQPDQDRVLVLELPYLQKLAVVLAETEPVLIERFLWWSMYRELLYLSTKIKHGEEQGIPRWKTCTKEVNANFGEPLSYLYVKRHFDQESRQKAIEMIEDVREAFAESIHQLEWMDSITREHALNKLKAIRNFVGFPAWILTHQQLDQHYQHVEVGEGSLFETTLNLTAASVKKSLESLRETPDRNKWLSSPTTVNAFYSVTLNSIMFPAGILQPPFFDNGIEAINYGSIGALMGHEITHGFDDIGRRYGEDGSMKQWWSAATLEHYNDKVQCIIDQYSKYHMAQLPNYTINGFNTQGENIADNGGLRAALRAYRRYLTRTPQAARDVLPALPTYTPEQLFFLGFAQIWCGNSTLGALKTSIVESPHSPKKIRVIGTLSNSEEFAQAWKCPQGSPMNPRHKCVLW